MKNANYETPDPDSRIAARWAAEALMQGRIELGHALARLAVQAQRYENTRMPAPLLDTPAQIYDEVSAATDNACTDEWQPAHADGSRPEICATCTAAGPTGNGDSDLRAVTEVLDPVPNTQRCVAQIRRGDTTDTCHGVIYWRAGTVGDEKTPPFRPGWFHVHPHLDTDHDPVLA